MIMSIKKGILRISEKSLLRFLLLTPRGEMY